MALTDGLRAYWTMNEASGARRDSVGNSRLAQFGSVTSGVGIQGRAAVFPGIVSNYLECVSNDALSMGDIDFTIAGWLNIAGVGTSQTFLLKGLGLSAAMCEYALLVSSSFMRFTVSNGSATATALLSISGLNGAWVFVAGLYNAATDEIFVRVNSTLSSAASLSGGAQKGGFNLRLGSQPSSSAFRGMWDELGIWGSLLSTAELNELYNNGTGLPLFGTGGSDGKSF